MCLLRFPPNGGTNRFIWDRNYSIFKQWALPSDSGESELTRLHVSAVRTWVKGVEERAVQSDSVRLPNKLVCHSSPPRSCFLFLSASCLRRDWWDLWRSWASCQELLIPLSGSGGPPITRLEKREKKRKNESKHMTSWERRFNWDVLCCWTVSFAYCTYEEAENKTWEISFCWLIKRKKKS